jgi:hypothetical protein
MNMTNYYTSITQSSKIVHTRPFLKSSFDVKAKPPSDSKIICDHFNARAHTFCKSWSKHLTCLCSSFGSHLLDAFEQEISV